MAAIAVSVAVVVLQRYDPLLIGAEGGCCHPPSQSEFDTRQVLFGVETAQFYEYIRLENQGSWAVKIDAVRVEESAALVTEIGPAEVRFADPQLCCLGSPSTPLQPFTLQGGTARRLLLRADVTHCPPVPINGRTLTIDALTVDWSVYGISHTSRLALDRPLIFVPDATCQGGQ